MIKRIIDAVKGKAPLSAKRSGKWPTVRSKHLLLNDKCAVCGSVKSLEVHHIVPFHVDPSKELDPNNLITLCETKNNGVNCHLLFGHLGNYKCYNNTVLYDAAQWNSKLRDRK